MSNNSRLSNRLDALEARLTGPKRIALFGHRNVGKTTLLAMFYRQASSGRIPGLRMAAAEPRTAEYLAEKIAQIESGQPMAGSLAETDLKLRLYHGPHAVRPGSSRIIQGEHVTSDQTSRSSNSLPTVTRYCSVSIPRAPCRPRRKTPAPDSRKSKTCSSATSSAPET